MGTGVIIAIGVYALIFIMMNTAILKMYDPVATCMMLIFDAISIANFSAIVTYCTK